MSIIMDLITNKVLVSTGVCWFVAQFLKVVIDGCKNGFSQERLTGSGGMPSSHSATVVSLTTSTALVYGVGGFEFPMALFFAIVVIYDAMGVRMETGREARALNRLMERDKKEGKEPVMEEPLREKMGHTLPEIIAGVAIGIIGAVIICNLMP